MTDTAGAYGGLGSTVKSEFQFGAESLSALPSERAGAGSGSGSSVNGTAQSHSGKSPMQIDDVPAAGAATSSDPKIRSLVSFHERAMHDGGDVKMDESIEDLAFSRVCCPLFIVFVCCFLV